MEVFYKTIHLLHEGLPWLALAMTIVFLERWITQKKVKDKKLS